MARETINNGAIANDGTGDTLRAAATKINNNFAELYSKFGSDGITLPASVQFGDDTITSAGYIELLSASGNTVKISSPSPAHPIDIRIPNLPQPGSSGDLINDEFITGTSTVTMSNKTLDSAQCNNIIISDGKISSGVFLDGNDNELINISFAALAVNELNISNAATGEAVSITATGDDTDVDLKLGGQAAGSVLMASTVAYEANTETASTGTIDLSKPLTFLSGSAATFTLPDGVSQGQGIRLINRTSSSDVTIEVTTFAAPDSNPTHTKILLKTNAGAELIWNGSGWILFSSTNDVDVTTLA